MIAMIGIGIIIWFAMRRFIFGRIWWFAFALCLMPSAAFSQAALTGNHSVSVYAHRVLIGPSGNQTQTYPFQVYDPAFINNYNGAFIGSGVNMGEYVINEDGIFTFTCEHWTFDSSQQPNVPGAVVNVTVKIEPVGNTHFKYTYLSGPSTGEVRYMRHTGMVWPLTTDGGNGPIDTDTNDLNGFAPGDSEMANNLMFYYNRYYGDFGVGNYGFGTDVTPLDPDTGEYPEEGEYPTPFANLIDFKTNDGQDFDIATEIEDSEMTSPYDHIADFSLTVPELSTAKGHMLTLLGSLSPTYNEAMFDEEVWGGISPMEDILGYDGFGYIMLDLMDIVHTYRTTAPTSYAFTWVKVLGTLAFVWQIIWMPKKLLVFALGLDTHKAPLESEA